MRSTTCTDDGTTTGDPSSQATHKQTVGFSLDYWLAHVVKPELRPSSHSRYEVMVQRHIKPVLGRKYAGRLGVRQTLAWVDGRARVQPPKTRASRRVIPLPEVVVTALREHEKRQDDERAAAGDR